MSKLLFSSRSTCPSRSACRVLAAFLVALVCGGRVSRVRADEAPRAAAKAALVEGVRCLDRHDHAEALRKFQEAYALVPSPKLHYNFGLAYAGLEDAPHALASFSRFLEEATDAPAAHRRAAERWVRKLRGQVGYVTVSSDVESTRVLVDGDPRGIVGQGHSWAVLPGLRQVVCDRGPGKPPLVRNVTVARGEVALVHCEQRERAAGESAELAQEVESAEKTAPAESAESAQPALIGSATPELSAKPPSAPSRAAVLVSMPALTSTPAKAPAGPAAASDASPFYRRWWFWTSLGLVLAGAGITTYLIVRHAPSENCSPDLTACAGTN